VALFHGSVWLTTRSSPWSRSVEAPERVGQAEAPARVVAGDVVEAPERVLEDIDVPGREQFAHPQTGRERETAERAADGLSSWCGDCHNAATRRWRGPAA
jgi:hypothetical protein